MFDHTNAVNKIFDRVHRTGEEVKNDLPNWVQRAVDNETWRQSVNPATDKPFASVGEWLVASWPLGPGMGHGEFAITYDEFILLCENRPKLKKLLVESRPKRKHGGDRKSDDAIKFDNIKLDSKPTSGTHRAYLEDRLARDFPTHWQDYIDGKYRSARQAAIAAGFLKDTHNPIDRLLSNWRKATKSQRLEFVKHLDANDKSQVLKWIASSIGGK
jgi:hypothetical protein